MNATGKSSILIFRLQKYMHNDVYTYNVRQGISGSVFLCNAWKVQQSSLRNVISETPKLAQILNFFVF